MIAQTAFKFSEFAIVIMEGLIILLERQAYLKGEEEKSTIANGVYSRSLKFLRKNGLKIQIPRRRNGPFKPVALDLVRHPKEQMNELALLFYRKGLSSRDVSDVITGYFGDSMRRDTVN